MTKFRTLAFGTLVATALVFAPAAPAFAGGYSAVMAITDITAGTTGMATERGHWSGSPRR